MAKVSLLNLPLAAPALGVKAWLPNVSQRALPWLLPIGLFFLWWLAAREQWMSEQILPPPSLVWQSALELGAGELWGHLAISLQRLFFGLLVGVGIGAVLGATLGLSRVAQRLVLPTFSKGAAAPGDAQLWIVDPHGNLVLRYDAKVKGKDLLNDLRHLLKLSNIG